MYSVVPPIESRLERERREMNLAPTVIEELKQVFGDKIK